MDKEFISCVGLKNIGNTCYMNSALQIIVHCNILSNTLLKSHKLLGNLSETYRKFLHKYNNTKNNKYITPNNIKEKIGEKFISFSDFDQQDSHEFLICFLDYLEEDFKLNKIDIVSQLFDCKIRTEIKSTVSNEESVKIDLVRFLCVPIPEKENVSLDDCFNEFIKTEVLEEDTIWETPNKNKEVAIKNTFIIEFPKYLIFQLKRFIFDISSRKNNTRVCVESNWFSDLLPDDTYYELKGLVLQSGDVSGGHYVSYIKINNKWYCFNDKNVTETEKKFVLLIATKAYMLFFVKRKKKKRESPNYEFSKEEMGIYNKKYRLIK